MTTPKQEAIIQALKCDPTLSNRAIGRAVNAHHVTVGTVRAKLEKAGELQRTDTLKGADGKSYSKAKISRPKAAKANASKPLLIDKLVSSAMAGLLHAAQKDGGLDELADAFRRYYVPHLVPPPIMPEVPVATEVADPPSVTAKPQEPAREPSQSHASPAPKVRDVARDIQPDADNDDYGDLPTEERIALYEDPACLNRTPAAGSGREPEPTRVGEWWEFAKVVHLHQATQCGRVRLHYGVELNFTDKTPLEPGLVLKVGLEVDCRMVEQPGRYPTIAELASPLPA
jgi:hypothetical protein